MRGTLLSAFLLATACATSFVPSTNSSDALTRYVENAARIVERKGPAACADFDTARWRSGEYYIFVTSADTNITICHPIRHDLIGQDQTNLTDSNGKHFIREMLTLATSTAARGWVDYTWPRPGQTTPERKSAYVIGVTGPDGKRYVVGSGAYGVVH